MLAAGRGDAASVGVLLAAGADPRGRDAHGATALHWAARRRDAGVCGQLVAAGCGAREVDESDMSAVDYARVLDGREAGAQMERWLTEGAASLNPAQ